MNQLSDSNSLAEIVQVLPDSVANQIAAGEVIQRPASVLKELVENSIDSGASKVEVLVKESGKNLIQVIDNGSGMSEVDARLALERHATSKICKAEDLFEIHSMGFRGEALPSIVSVSQTEIKTKEGEAETGIQIVVEGSAVKKQEPAVCKTGTNIRVKNLFYNIPARRKFLKSNQVEFKHILEQFQRIALAFPEIHFELKSDDKEYFVLPKAKLKQRIIAIMGKRFDDSLVALKEETEIANISGFLGKPEISKKGRGEQYIFVNNRFIKSPYLHHAILGAYQDLIPYGHNPSYFIFFEVDPERIDINIHPTKTEIKFADENAIYAILKSVAKRSLGANNISPSLDFDRIPSLDVPMSKDTPLESPKIEVNPNYDPFAKARDSYELPQKEIQFNPPEHVPSNPVESTGEEAPVEPVESPACDSKFFQIGFKYLVSKVKSGAMVVNIYRALERIHYEQNLHALANQKNLSQKQMFPELVELSSVDFQQAIAMKEQLALLGFDFESMGGDTISINGIPTLAEQSEVSVLLQDMLDHFRESEQKEGMGKLDGLAKSVARAEARGFRRILKQEEMEDVIDRLFACEQPNYSPSGKPTIQIISVEELDQRFQ